MERAYRDPVHDFITVSDPLLLALVDTPEFQRLRRIRQLGATYGTYHGAEHSRFGHSLGVMWIMTKILDRFQRLGVPVDAWTRTVAVCAALLHDVGHGPLSHALEGILTPGRHHEAWTREILLGETAIGRALAAHSAELPAAVAAVLEGSWPGPRFVTSLVSSQLDVDRMDYLLRDSLYTGVTYGRFDLERLINTLLVVDGDVVLMRKGVVAAEEYLLARYLMYWQVYLHKTTRGQEAIIRQVWRRAKELWQQGGLAPHEVPPSLHRALADSVGLEEYLRLDDLDMLYACKLWAGHEDRILRDLAGRFLDRRLLKPVFKVPHAEVPLDRHLEAARELVRRHGWDPDYYLLVDRTTDVAYDTYSPEEQDEGHRPILALDEAGRPQEIATLSETIRAIASRPKVAVNLFVPEECLGEVRRLLVGDERGLGQG